MNDIDLFGELIITNTDVKMFLQHVVNINNCTQSRIEYYIKYHDVVNKIKLLKLSNRFTETIELNKNNDTIDDFHLSKLFNKYLESQPDLKQCPPYYHRCTNKECPVYLKNARWERNRASYLERKKRAHIAP